MGKLDKKVLKVISTQEDMDYDVDDISIALKCDDMEVQEALDSLKDQGLIEAVIHNGKKFWKPARAEAFISTSRPEARPGPTRDETSIDLLILEQPAQSFKPREQQTASFQRTPAQPQRTISHVAQASKQQFDQEQTPMHPISGSLPIKRSYDNDVDDNTRIFTPPTQLAKVQPTPIEEKFDDDEFDQPKRSGSSLGVMAIAVLLAAGVSALITMSLTQNIGKGFNDAIVALEGKLTEANAKLNQRMDALSLKVDNMQANIAAHPTVAPEAAPQVKTLPIKSVSKKAIKPARPMAVRTVKKAAQKRAAPGASKNRKSASEMIQETSASATTSEVNPVSSMTPEATSAPVTESAGEIAKSPSASPAATESVQSAEPSSPPVASEPASPSTSSGGGVWESSAPPSTDGSAQ
jgi:hypothetical protein